jgi:hypothetical protein
MTADRDDLKRAAIRAATQAGARRPTGVEALTDGIHRGELGRWVTIQSFALPPVPVAVGTEWQLVSLLAIADDPEAATIMPPWAAVTWGLPEGKVLEKIRLAEHPVAGPIRAGMGPVELRFDPSRLSRLYRGLDRVLALSPSDVPGMAGLAPAYDGLLPGPLRPLVHAIAPDTSGWLTP